MVIAVNSRIQTLCGVASAVVIFLVLQVGTGSAEQTDVNVAAAVSPSGAAAGNDIKGQPKEETGDSVRPDKVVELEANISRVVGKHVQVTTDGGQTWNSAQVDDKLGRNGAVRTGFASGCDVRFGEHSLVEVKALSSMRVADYLRADNGEVVRASVRYGAIRCGVDQSRVKTDTRISTPVSTLGIRGTVVAMTYDPSLGKVDYMLAEHGPAIVKAFVGGVPDGPGYVLEEGMQTDQSLTRSLDKAIEGRVVWLSGSPSTGGISKAEGAFLTHIGSGAAPPVEGGLGDAIKKLGLLPEDDHGSTGGPCDDCDW